MSAMRMDRPAAIQGARRFEERESRGHPRNSSTFRPSLLRRGRRARLGAFSLPERPCGEPGSQLLSHSDRHARSLTDLLDQRRQPHPATVRAQEVFSRLRPLRHIRPMTKRAFVIHRPTPYVRPLYPVKARRAPAKCAIVSRPVARDTHLLCHRCRVNCNPPSPKTGPGADLAAPIRKERAAAAPTCQIGAVGGAVIGTVREGYGAKERGQESASDRDRRGECVAFLGLLSPQRRIGRTIDPARSRGPLYQWPHWHLVTCCTAAAVREANRRDGLAAWPVGAGSGTSPGLSEHCPIEREVERGQGRRHCYAGSKSTGGAEMSVLHSGERCYNSCCVNDHRNHRDAHVG